LTQEHLSLSVFLTTLLQIHWTNSQIIITRRTVKILRMYLVAIAAAAIMITIIENVEVVLKVRPQSIIPNMPSCTCAAKEEWTEYSLTTLYSEEAYMEVGATIHIVKLVMMNIWMCNIVYCVRQLWQHLCCCGTRRRYENINNNRIVVVRIVVE
jgi:hypothetical protein